MDFDDHQVFYYPKVFQNGNEIFDHEMIPKFSKMELMIQEHLMFPNYSRSKGISNGSMDFDNACPLKPNT